MTPQQEINHYIKDARLLLNKAERVADTHHITFDFSVNYGMEGTYYPKKHSYNKNELLAMIENGSFSNLDYDTKHAAISVLSGEEENTDWNSSSESVWISSSSNC